MIYGKSVKLPDPRYMWSDVLERNDDDYSMLGLIHELKSDYGIVWTGFDHKGAEHKSHYKIVDNKKFGYFVIKHSDLIEVKE